MSALDDISILRASLYKVVRKNVKGLSAEDVVDVLKTVSEEMFEAGIDETLRLAEARIKKWENIADAWDLTWLTMFAYLLSLRKHEKRKR